MSENSTPDLSKIISTIIENPKLMEEIAKIAADKRTEEKAEASAEPRKAEENVSVAEASVSPNTQAVRNRRSDLLCALKPYLSGERAKAIDSMITIAQVLEVMKAR